MDTYEKKYNEALKWMRELYPGLHGATKEDAEHFFPELRESEEERIRKGLVKLLTVASETYLVEATGFKKEQFLSYLEKQKEPENVSASTMVPSCWAEEPSLQKEHKPNIELIQRSWYMAGYNDRKFGNEPKWIIKTGKGGPKHELNPKYGQPLADEQKPEWSEEDTLMLTAIIQTLERFGGRGTTGMQIDWLKSLRPSWKPSEEQEEPEYYQHFDPDC